MRCIEARRMVTPFIKKELSDKDAEQFMKHIEHCPDCMDELDIYFTVYNALDTLDCGVHHKEYDFRKMLEEDLRVTRYGILFRKLSRIFSRVLIGAVEILLIICVFTGFELKKGEVEKTTFYKAVDRMWFGHGAGKNPETMTETELQELLIQDNMPATEDGLSLVNDPGADGPGLVNDLTDGPSLVNDPGADHLSLVNDLQQTETADGLALGNGR